jgi:hypothetical protein
MDMSLEATVALRQTRATTLARSLFRQLREESVPHDEILLLTTTLLDLVVEDMKNPTEA